MAEASPEHGAPEPKRRKRHLILFVAMALFVLAYPVLGTLALWTGFVERQLRSEDLIVEIGNPAWTILPGRVHMKSARVLSNGETQFDLSGKNLTFHVKVLELFSKRLHVTTLIADDVRYQMRVQVKTTKGIEERIAAYPKLPGLPGDPTLLLPKAAKTEKRERDYTVEVGGIEVKVAELWFMEYRYLGDGTLRGGFLLGPNRMRVVTSVQELGPGELRFGPDQVIAKRFRGRIETTIPEIDPEEHADESFLELVEADVDLAGDVVSLKHVDAYLDGMRMVGGAGPFQTRFTMSKGRLGNGSRMTFKTDEVGLRGDGFGVDSDWSFDARVATARPTSGEKTARARGAADARTVGGDGNRKGTRDAEVLPRLQSRSKATYVSFSNKRNDVFTIQVHNHEEAAVLVSTQLGRMTDIAHAHLDFPEIVTTDIDDLAALGEKKTPIQTKGGAARASLRLDIDEKHVARGPFEASFDDLRFVVAGIRLSGDGKAACRIRIDLDDKATTLSDVAVRLSDVGMHVGDEDVEDWWMNLSTKQFAAWGLPPKRLETEFSVRAKDAEPILESLAEKDKINDLIAKLTSMDDLKMTATVRKNASVTDVMLEPLESEVWDVAGRLYAKGGKSRFALVIGGEAVSLGIANDGKKTSIKPFARTGWLNEQLRRFPKPVEQVTSSQP